MDITSLGHASFKIRGKSASVVTDPFDTKSVGLKFPKVDADIVTISHHHDDHNKSDIVKDVKKVIDGPGEYEVMGVSFIGITTYHDDKKGDLRGKNVIYVIEIDGFRILHLGDLGHKLSEKIMDSLGEIDILMVPVGGVYTIDVSIASEVVRGVGPSITIPMHYQMPGLNKEVFAKLAGVDAFLVALGLPVERISKLSLKASSFRLFGAVDGQEKDQRVVVLERK